MVVYIPAIDAKSSDPTAYAVACSSPSRTGAQRTGATPSAAGGGAGRAEIALRGGGTHVGPRPCRLPHASGAPVPVAPPLLRRPTAMVSPPAVDRKSTRLNSSHVSISYAVFCLKKKNI